MQNQGLVKCDVIASIIYGLPLTFPHFLPIILPNIVKATTEESTLADIARDVWSIG
jgi:hypothetical protein